MTDLQVAVTNALIRAKQSQLNDSWALLDYPHGSASIRVNKAGYVSISDDGDVGSELTIQEVITAGRLAEAWLERNGEQL